jgi:hypothetical protein
MKGIKMDEGDGRLLEPVTERIIGCAFRVANALGHGFAEKVYENALAHEMRKRGLGAVQQRGIVVFYDDVIVGEFTADLLIEDQVIVELIAGIIRAAACRTRINAKSNAGKRYGGTSRKSGTTANPETWIAAAGNARPCSIGLTTAGSSEVSSVPRRPVIR